MFFHFAGSQQSTHAPTAAPSFPDASTTGPQAGTSFTNTSGTISTSSDGQVIADLNISPGHILVNHDNVTIRDCIIDAGDPFGVFVQSPVTGLQVIRCRITGDETNHNTGIGTETAPGTEIAYCDISVFENAIEISSNNVNVHDNYFHDLAYIGADPHTDGIQGFIGASGLTVNHNTIIGVDTSCMIMNTNNDMTVTNNLFLWQGGAVGLAYGIQVNNSNNTVITNNHIGNDTAWPNFPIDIINCTNYTISGNVDHVTGDPVNPSIS